MLGRMKTHTFRVLATILGWALLAGAPAANGQQHSAPKPPKSVRLYILDCGKIIGVGETAFGFEPGSLANSDMVTPCYLIVHPNGSLLWDTGQISDVNYIAPGPAVQGAFTVDKPLLPQLAELGYTPDNITYLAMSHYHGDHVANANLFARSIWIVQRAEHEAMFAPTENTGPTGANIELYRNLQTAKTLLLNNEDHDVFGDGSVVLKFAPGHTPGHQAIFLRLKRTGPVLLSGDLYHYPEELTHKLIPSFDTDKEQTAKSRAAIEDFAAKERAQLWIQHDIVHDATLKKTPQFYE